MTDAIGNPKSSARADAVKKTEPLLEQLGKVGNHFFSAQTQLAKKSLHHWPANVWGMPVTAEDFWVSWVDMVGDMAQAWFTWVQIFDVMAGSGWAGATSQVDLTKPGQCSEVFTIEQTDETDISLPSLTNLDTGQPLPSTSFTLDPRHITATSRDVTVTVTPPPNTPQAEYIGDIIDAKGVPRLHIAMVIGTE